MRWTEKQLHRIPAMCCELQPTTPVILILRPDGETPPCMETDGLTEPSKGEVTSCVTVSDRATGSISRLTSW